MKIKVYYRKNLKLSSGKLAAQVAHVSKELGRKVPNTIAEDDVVIVLGLSDKKFEEYLVSLETHPLHYHIQSDKGYTEVEPNTITCAGHIEETADELLDNKT